MKLPRWIAVVSTSLGLMLGGNVASASASTTLHIGSTGSTVTQLQHYLDQSSKGDFFSYTPGHYTSYFGPVTQTGLKRWQTAMHYRATGTIAVGSSQWNTLMSQMRHTTSTIAGLPAGIDARSVAYAKREGWAIDASKTTNKLHVLRYANGKLQVVVTADARYGDKRGPSYATRNGVWRIFSKGGANFRSNLYANSDGRGVLMPYPAFFSGGEAIHYSYDFAAYGYSRASHGCLNLRSWSAVRYIHDRVPMHTVVVVHQ